MEMKYPLIAVILVSALILGIFVIGQKGVSTVFDLCTWAPDYWFISCLPYTEVPKQVQMTSSGIISPIASNFVCPTGADVQGCIITKAEGAKVYYANSCGNWNCDGKVFVTAQGTDLESQKNPLVPSGKLVLYETGGFNVPALVYATVVRKQLYECGTSACGPGSGVPLPNSGGCIWQPSSGNVPTNQVTAANVEPLPTSGIDYSKVDPPPVLTLQSPSTKYIYTQHLVSCASDCASDLQCPVPATATRTGTTTYNGKTVNYYVSGGYLHLVGCAQAISTQVCDLYDTNKVDCLKWSTTQNSQCGDLTTVQFVGCGNDADCASPSYSCQWNSATLRGECKPTYQATPSGCTTDLQCQSVAPSCVGRYYSAKKCVSGSCALDSKQVACCVDSDCSSGYYCSSDYVCRQSVQVKPEPPTGECRERDPDYKDRLCSSMTGGTKNVCCPSTTAKRYQCTSRVEDCGPPSTVVTAPSIGDFFGDMFKGVGDFVSVIYWVLVGAIVLIVGAIALKIVSLLSNR